MTRLIVRMGLWLVVCSTVVTGCIVLSQRRAFGNIGTIVFTMGGDDYTIYSIKPNGDLGEAFKTYSFPVTFESQFIAAIDCSADGRYFVFYDQYLYRVDAETERLTQMSARPLPVASRSAVSPDGSTIALALVYDEAEVLLITPSDDTAEKLTPNAMHEYAVTWSPDGSKLAFAASEAVEPPIWFAIEIMDVATGEMTIIYETRAIIANLSWSPDGERIVFSMPDGGYWQIFTIAPDGTQLRRLTEGRRDNIQPRWSPDGSLISYSSRSASSTHQLYVIDRDGGIPYLVYGRLRGADVYNQCWLRAE